MGLKQVYGNFNPTIEKLLSAQRTKRRFWGDAPSALFATNESNFGRTVITDIMGCSKHRCTLSKVTAYRG